MVSAEITKATAGYWFADTGQGTYRCRARGIFKKRGETPLVGDFVRITVQDEEEGVLEEILERRNSFVRPPVANIDMMVVTVAAASPEPITEIIDRLLASAEAADVEPVVCINKEDLSEGVAERLRLIYEGIYPTAVVSAGTCRETDSLMELVKGRRAAFAGASGVGKTSLLACLLERDDLETGGVSAKTGRGRHTTRVVETFRTKSGAVLYDTPGFTAFASAETNGLRPELLFPEIARSSEACRFANCEHTDEPGCAVKAAVKSREIAKSRYASYLAVLSDFKEGEAAGGSACRRTRKDG